MHTNRRSLFHIMLVVTASLLWSSMSVAGLFSNDPVKEPLPQFNVPSLSGKHLTNKTMEGHVSLLNVWASWCGYCRKEHGMLMKIKNTYHIPIYSLDLKDNPSDAKLFLASEGNPFVLVGMDWNGDVSSALNVYSTPQTFVIDKHGNIRLQHSGGVDQSDWNNELWPLIQKLEKES